MWSICCVPFSSLTLLIPEVFPTPLSLNGLLQSFQRLIAQILAFLFSFMFPRYLMLGVAEEVTEKGCTEWVACW